ncbi:uncharacterized protein LOC143284598 isoform X2 [Babylonia areolata]|uniref:uncharacterized protein LOC143284598 isoform X2 n=2 Tax=Babylonia areolata TaxID=304850 RepID=UPI003FD2E8CB
MIFAKMGSDEDVFFFQQAKYRTAPRRFRKLPEDLPESLKFAHLNPKVAAYLASKEKQKQEEDLFGDGLGKKSLMPEINQAFMSIKNRLDSSLSNDEDSQRYLFEEARVNAGTVLMQLAKIIYTYDDIASHIPKSLEYQLMCGVKELTTDVIIVPREWQTFAMKEAHAKMLASAADGNSDEEDAGPNSYGDEGRSTRAPSIVSTVMETGPPPRGGKKRVIAKGGQGLPEIVEDGEKTDTSTDQPRGRRNDSRMSISSRTAQRRDRGRSMDKTSGPGSVTGRSPGMRRGMHDYELMSALTETPSDNRSTAMANPSYYVSMISFQLSSKVCEEKGWIVQKGREEELAKEAVYDWCVQTLQQAHKLINDQKAQEKEMGYDQAVQVRYYGDTRKETLLKYRKSPVKATASTVAKGGKPKIPSMYDDQNEGKQLMLAGHLDGTAVAYYPSGRPAVIASAAGFGRSGFYTVAYEDDLDMKMLACFTPSGHGVCYHGNGNIRFVANSKGGHLAEWNGTIERRWKWSPGGVKITTPVGFQLNSNLAFRCVSESHMVLLFSCAKETARFPVAASQSEPSPRSGEETEQLLTNFTFSSRAARDLLRLFAPKSKSHKSKGRKKDKLNRQLAELVKSVDSQEKSLYDIEADKELARLQRKSRQLIDDWMEHYRIAIGLSSPHLHAMPESPRVRRRRQTQSAKPWDGDKIERRGTLGLEQKEVTINVMRAPSAPSAARKSQRGNSARSSVPSPTRSTVSLTVKFDRTADGGQAEEEGVGVGEDSKDLTTSVVSLSKFSESSNLRSRSAGNLSKPVSRQGTTMSLPDREFLPSLTLCPAALRQMALNEGRPSCRCSRHTIPTITDVEYERYINKECPRSQLQIIMVHSSLFPNTNPAESMVNHIHANQNRNRTRPCLQSRNDPFRIFRYDINMAAEDSDHTQPLLLTRHNVVPGMFLIYGDSRLLFCDHILNGYGYTQRDFKKQISKCRVDFLHGQSLPNDFRFSPSKGRHGLRAAWGGDIGGTGVDRFGAPGTTLSRSLTDIPGSDKSLSLYTASQADQAGRGMKARNIVKNVSCSDVPSLPPLPLPPLQRHQHGGQGLKHNPVRLRLPAAAPFAQFSAPSRPAASRQPAEGATAVSVPDQITA